ncbi:hypothetical protein ACA910_016254 [Epithemia clementina (nom. ined.)]
MSQDSESSDRRSMHPSSIRNNGNGTDLWARNWLFGNAETTYVETMAERIPKEIGCALAASSLVSPLVTIIDKSIVQDISGASKFMKATSFAAGELLFTPTVFFRSLSFRLTLGVYFGTFAVANLAEAAMDARKMREREDRKHIKVAAASVANISLLAWRDSVFARQFGTKGSAVRPNLLTPPPFCLRALSLFAARDSATMYSTFYLAPRASEYLQNEHDVDRNTAALSMALAIPTVTQFITAPMHIFAMDLCQNRKASLAHRLQVIRKEYSTVAMARGLRILPAFGIGSFTNNKLREWFIRQQNENLLLTRRITKFLTKRPETNDPRGRVLKG